ncbi:hypothetical protein [Devosia sp. 63-57]|uniref:hypothetical protein n=1 Tax=Devosia sp. 63-57 TaxID=1895751 RepID=UPI0008685CB9|nr:hypothetical protein [Devosia sp. 63-57]ODT47076.1 MAG: hypothetical protein ABS74_12230 [Pelagibacterium sp. SCN 63-126]ODU88893.1 MAG: hypothetical protein ABT14_01105 [Pelagibacterium sp. SCN 63-17]OJX43213.1 MAG: hypothetical protein BGO80_17640 [Devosia sp. 63-57]
MTNKEVYAELERVSSLLSAIDALWPKGAPMDTATTMAGLALQAGEILSIVMNDMDLGVPEMPEMVSMRERPN